MNSPTKETIKSYDKAAKIYAEHSFSRISQYQLMQFIQFLNTGKKVLDVGCGAGRDAEYLREEGFDVIGIDASEGMIEEAKSRVGGDFRVMDMKKLDFDEKSFDGIWCCASLFHIPKQEVSNVLDGFHKALKDEGVLYVAVKEGQGEKVTKDKIVNLEPRYYSYFSQPEIEKQLVESGFKIITAYSEEIEGVTWLNLFASKNS